MVNISRRTLGLGALSLGLFPSVSFSSANTPDKALLLLADVSASIHNDNYLIQQKGMAEAFRDIYNINSLRGQSIAVHYNQWASDIAIPERTGWTILKTQSDYRAYADFLENYPRASAGNATAIHSALTYAKKMVMSFQGTLPSEFVIDISGDGIENNVPGISAHLYNVLGEYNKEIRDDVLNSSSDSNITINGIIIENGQSPPEPKVEDFYREYICGGNQSFVIAVNNFTEFKDAFRRKLVMELG